MTIDQLAGAMLQKEREKRNIKQETIAALLKISRAEVSKIENGKIHITLIILKNYCQILKIAPESIMTMI